MDTKLKKCKIIVSFIVFVLGVSLLLNGVVKGINVTQEGSWNEQLSMAFEDDYQNTGEFRWYISDSLEDFLAMAAGAPIGQHWSRESGNNYYESYVYHGNVIAALAEETAVGSAAYESSVSSSSEQTVVEDGTYNSDYEESIYRDAYSDIYTDYDENGDITYYSLNEDGYVTSSSPELNKKMAEKIHKSIKNDKNLLYTIHYDNKVMYENTDDIHLDGTAGTLPEGYNFLLYFDGNTVTITKDGKELDIYGEGYYKEDSKWHVPGYKNFTVGEDAKRTTVCIAVAQSPMLYMTTGYGTNNYRQNESGLYQIAYSMREHRDSFMNMGASLFGAVIFLAVSVIFRKNKKQGDLFLAKITGRLWYEVKVILLVFGVGLLLIASSYALDEMVWMFQMEGRLYFSSFLRGFLRNTRYVLLLFWSLYLFLNDWCYNKKSWKHSIICKAMGVFKAKELKMEFQIRMIHRYKIMILAECAMIALTILVFFILDYTDVFSRIIGTGAVMWLQDIGRVFLMFFVAFLMLIIQIYYFKKNKAVFADMGKLMEQIKAIREGNLTESMEFSEDGDLLEAVKELNDIQQGMSRALDEQMNSERMKVELVSNVSHDIKTPLTSIISYVELLEQEENLPEHVKDYIRILSSKSERLKGMVQDVFEVSKAASGQLLVKIEELDLGKLLRQTLADMEIRIESSSVSVKTEILEEAVMIMADGQRLYRVFQNLLQNALQYSLQGSRVFVTLKIEDSIAVASVKNTSESEISDGIDVTERFTRGDASRSDEGSGLGLSIAKSFTEACGGIFQVEVIADLFVVTVKFHQK